MVHFNFVALRITPFFCTLKKCKKTLLSTVKATVHNQYHAGTRESHGTPRNGPWNVLFFGTDEFAVESLKVLYNKYESRALQRLEVVTARKKKENAVIKYARKKGIVINEWPLEINVSQFHIGIVVSFGHMIPLNVINAFPLGMLNVHGSMLPRWRGAAPIIYSLMNGDQQTGITITKIMPKKFDIGKIVLQKETGIGDHETLPELYSRLAKLGANLLMETFENLPELLESATPQNEENVTYAPKITSEIAVIKWNEMSAKNVYDLHRALLGLFPLTAKFQDTKIKLHDVKNIGEPIAAILKLEPPGVSVYDKKSEALIIKCKGESCISVKEVVFRGKCMNAQDFYNGFIAGRNKTKTAFS